MGLCSGRAGLVHTTLQSRGRECPQPQPPGRFSPSSPRLPPSILAWVSPCSALMHRLWWPAGIWGRWWGWGGSEPERFQPVSLNSSPGPRGERLIRREGNSLLHPTWSGLGSWRHRGTWRDAVPVQLGSPGLCSGEPPCVGSKRGARSTWGGHCFSFLVRVAGSRHSDILGHTGHTRHMPSPHLCTHAGANVCTSVHTT